MFHPLKQWEPCSHPLHAVQVNHCSARKAVFFLGRGGVLMPWCDWSLFRLCSTVDSFALSRSLNPPVTSVHIKEALDTLHSQNTKEYYACVLQMISPPSKQTFRQTVCKDSLWVWEWKIQRIVAPIHVDVTAKVRRRATVWATGPVWTSKRWTCSTCTKEKESALEVFGGGRSD